MNTGDQHNGYRKNCCEPNEFHGPYVHVPGTVYERSGRETGARSIMAFSLRSHLNPEAARDLLPFDELKVRGKLALLCQFPNVTLDAPCVLKGQEFATLDPRRHILRHGAGPLFLPAGETTTPTARMCLRARTCSTTEFEQKRDLFSCS